MKIRLSGIINDSIVDGVGIRFVVFTQGCPHHCEGCHNPGTHDFSGGYDDDTDEILAKIKANPLLDGVTLSGGEPFCQPKPLYELCLKVKALGLNIACYSGYTFEELLKLSENNEDIKKLLSVIDVLIDGRFVLLEKSLLLRFKGSKNQRILNLPASLAEGKAVLMDSWQ